MILRPHHLLCTQGYSGKGYSDDFVHNMTAITDRLRYEEEIAIDIVFSTDDICTKCPNMICDGLCRPQDKVRRFDMKAAQFFEIEEKRYIYRDIVGEIKSKVTESILEDICSDCIWYPVSACKRKILCGRDRSRP